MDFGADLVDLGADLGADLVDLGADLGAELGNLAVHQNRKITKTSPFGQKPKSHQNVGLGRALEVRFWPKTKKSLKRHQ